MSILDNSSNISSKEKVSPFIADSVIHNRFIPKPKP